MDTNQIKAEFDQADQHLAAAKSELNRPAEDVVPFMVCRSARYSLSYYLKGFLLKHQINFEEEVSVETLLEKCRVINDKFNELDLSLITFAEDHEYSADFDEMEGCINLAEYAKQLAGE